MRSSQGMVLEALYRAKDFLDKHAELLDSVNKASARRHLEEAMSQLAAHGATQDGSARASKGEMARQQRLQQTLRSDQMRPIALVARRRVEATPEVRRALRMPRGNLSTQQLVAAAVGMADAASAHEEVLVDGGLPAGFLEQFRAATTALETALVGRRGFVSTRVRSTAGLTQEEQRGRHILRVLDSLVLPKLGGDQSLGAEWRSARSIRRLPRPTLVVTPGEQPATPGAAKPEVKPTASVTHAPEVAA